MTHRSEPKCRDCEEGKHGACIGEALVEFADGTIAETTCACSDVGHIPSPDFPDAADKWVIINFVGGYVCSVCEEPVESEPCRQHQPNAYAQMEGIELVVEPPSPHRESDVPLWETLTGEEATSG